VQLLKFDAKLAHAYMSRGFGNTLLALSTATNLTTEFAVIILLDIELPTAIADVLIVYNEVEMPVEFIIKSPANKLFAVNVLFDSNMLTFNSDII
jgi:hypothetical protein